MWMLAGQLALMIADVFTRAVVYIGIAEHSAASASFSPRTPARLTQGLNVASHQAMRVIAPIRKRPTFG